MRYLIRHARKSLELHKWCTLRFSLKQRNASALSNSSSATSYLSQEDNFIISSFIDLMGYIRKISRRLSEADDEEEDEDHDSVSNLFRSHGFQDRQRSRIITCYPRNRIADSKKSLGLQLYFLQSRGSSSFINLYSDFVRDTLQDKESDRMISDNIIRDVFILKQLGVPQVLLLTLLSVNTSVNEKEKFKESIKKVVEKGFDPTTLKIFQALRVFYVLKDKSIEEKFNVYTASRRGLST